MGSGLGRRLASVHWDVVGQMVTAWIFTIPAAALLGAAAWEISNLFSSSDAGSLVIALMAIAGAGVLFRLARRSQITPEDLDRTAVIPAAPVVQIPYTAPASA
jgi:PiT family inorganic phosphate transporter